MMPIQNEKRELENEIERIKNAPHISQKDQELLLQFKRDLKVEKEVGNSRVRKLISFLRLILKEKEKIELHDADKEDIKKLIEKQQARDISEWTLRDYKKSVKRFFKWKNEGEYPEKVEWIKTTKKSNETLPEDLLRKEDIEKMRAHQKESANHSSGGSNNT